MIPYAARAETARAGPGFVDAIIIQMQASNRKSIHLYRHSGPLVLADVPSGLKMSLEIHAIATSH